MADLQPEALRLAEQALVRSAKALRADEVETLARFAIALQARVSRLQAVVRHGVDGALTDEGTKTDAHPPAAPARCHLCDCTGDIHDSTGAWRGKCPRCKPEPLEPFLVRDIADMLGTDVPRVSKAFTDLGFFPPRSTNMAVTPDEAVAAAKHLTAAPALVPLTDEQIDALIARKHFDPKYIRKDSDEVVLSWYRLGLREGEQAHGINGLTVGEGRAS